MKANLERTNLLEAKFVQTTVDGAFFADAMTPWYHVASAQSALEACERNTPFHYGEGYNEGQKAGEEYGRQEGYKEGVDSVVCVHPITQADVAAARDAARKEGIMVGIASVVQDFTQDDVELAHAEGFDEGFEEGQKTTLESYAAELLEDGHSAKKIAAALKRSLKFGGTVAEQLAGGVCMNKKSNKWCASQLCLLPQAQGPACETLNQDQCEAAEFCAAASSGLEFNEQGKLLLKTKCTAVKSRCEKNSCQKQCKLACGAC